MIISSVIPKHLDDPPRFLFWPIDEAFCLISPLFLGLVLEWFFGGLILAVALVSLIRKLKIRYGKHFFWLLAYWYLPNVGYFSHGIPDSYLRELIG